MLEIALVLLFAVAAWCIVKVQRVTGAREFDHRKALAWEYSAQDDATLAGLADAFSKDPERYRDELEALSMVVDRRRPARSILTRSA